MDFDRLVQLAVTLDTIQCVTLRKNNRSEAETPSEFLVCHEGHYRHSAEWERPYDIFLVCHEGHYRCSAEWERLCEILMRTPPLQLDEETLPEFAKMWWKPGKEDDLSSSQRYFIECCDVLRKLNTIEPITEAQKNIVQTSAAFIELLPSRKKAFNLQEHPLGLRRIMADKLNQLACKIWGLYNNQHGCNNEKKRKAWST